PPGRGVIPGGGFARIVVRTASRDADVPPVPEKPIMSEARPRTRSVARRAHAPLCMLLLLLAAAGCSDDGVGVRPPEPIGTAGGTVTSADGKVTLVIPP